MPNFKSGMPAFGEVLGHDEIVAVLTHVKSLWGDKTKLGFYIRESQALVSEKRPFAFPLGVICPLPPSRPQGLDVVHHMPYLVIDHPRAQGRHCRIGDTVVDEAEESTLRV